VAVILDSLLVLAEGDQISSTKVVTFVDEYVNYPVKEWRYEDPRKRLGLVAPSLESKYVGQVRYLGLRYEEWRQIGQKYLQSIFITSIQQ